MRQQYSLVCLLLLFISGSRTQDSTATIQPTATIPSTIVSQTTTTVTLPPWNGDPLLCIPDQPPAPAPSPPRYPEFNNQVEFTLERVEIRHAMNATLSRELTLYQYIYDYDANKLIVVKNTNGFLQADYYYYNVLKKSTYFGRDFCSVTDITTYDEMDGNSAIQLPDGTWHVRSMQELLLFGSEDPNRRVTPVYLGKDKVRGIPVDKWQSCYVNKTTYRTMRRIWYFAEEGYVMPSGPVGNLSIPVQAIISASFDLPDATQVIEFDEVYNVYGYRNGILETNDALSPPKGVFCDSGEGQKLVSLKDVGITWPDRFSVRVEASSSRSSQWQRFHLRYDQGRSGGGPRRIRYDYLPAGAEDYESVIHDYTDNLTYTIDRRVGTCKIERGVAISDVSPTRDPIRFFIRNEARFIYSPPENAWEYNGLRSCRGDSIKCAVATSSVPNFPSIVESDTGKPTGEFWEATNVEYNWGVRSPYAQPPPDQPKQFDYPVSLYLKMYRYQNPSDPSPFSIVTEDIEYEFYEMSHERNQYDFDTSICFRSNQREYIHDTFTLKLNQGNIIDGNHLNRAALERNIHTNLMNIMQVKGSRVADLEVEHERVSNDVSVFFTILGQTPNPDVQDGVNTDEPTAAQANEALKSAINAGQYRFTMKLEDGTDVAFEAVPNSLKASKLYMSSHAAGQQSITERYTAGSQAAAIIVGLLIGIVVGVIIIAIVRVARKEPMPALPTSISNRIPTINYHSKPPSTPAPETSTA